MASSNKTILNPQTDNDSGRCPLCGVENDCALCSGSASNDPCWCVTMEFPDELLARVPETARNRACICRKCVESFHARRAWAQTQLAVTGDYYFDANGLMVFTKAYLLRRGYCCSNECRHCPYQTATP